MNDSGSETASSIAPGLSGEVRVSDDAYTMSENWIVELGLTSWYVLKGYRLINDGPVDSRDERQP